MIIQISCMYNFILHLYLKEFCNIILYQLIGTFNIVPNGRISKSFKQFQSRELTFFPCDKVMLYFIHFVLCKCMMCFKCKFLFVLVKVVDDFDMVSGRG